MIRSVLLSLLVLTSPSVGEEVDPQTLAAARDRVDRAVEQRIAMLARVRPAVLSIYEEPVVGGGGSGVIIDPTGYALTNVHVVQGVLETRRGYAGLSDGRMFAFDVIGIDPAGDIALIKLIRADDEPLPFVQLGDAHDLRLGDAAFAVGNPFALNEDFRSTATAGIVSGLNRYQEGTGEQRALLEYADCIQVSSSINPGNSGGPLFNAAGELVGINGRASFEERGRVNVGLGYAVSINQIKRFLPSLRAGKLVEHGTLGATLRSVGRSLLINTVPDFSAAQAAGLKPGDELRAIDGRIVQTENDVSNLITTYPAGWPVELTIRRDNEEQRITARLDRVPIQFSQDWIMDLDVNHRALREVLTRAAESFWKHQPILQLIENDPNRDSRATAPLEEARGLLTPVLFPPAEFDVRWEYPGGTRVGERIVSIIEYRASAEQRWHWLIDERSGALHAIHILDADQNVVRRWVARSERSLHDAAALNTVHSDLAVRLIQPSPAPVKDFELELTHALVADAEPPAPTTFAPPAAQRPARSLHAAAVEAARRRVVRIYGGAIGRAEGYASGMLVSSDGLVLTPLAALLESPRLRVVLPDGRRYPAEVLRRDNDLQLALLQIAAVDTAFFPLETRTRPRVGASVLAAANPFKVAAEAEPVSVLAGIVAGHTTLEARRRAQRFSYSGEVLLTDAIVATPGAAGGALVDREGNLLGMIGRAVISDRTNTWLNYAIPAAVLHDWLTEPPTVANGNQADPVSPLDLGLRILDLGHPQWPTYVERVRPNGPAWNAGLRPDDLLLMLAGRPVETCEQFNAARRELIADGPLELVLKRGDEILTVTITPEPR